MQERAIQNVAASAQAGRRAIKVGLLASAALLAAALGPAGASRAQQPNVTAEGAADTGPTIKIYSSVKGAAPAVQPAPNTPVAPQYQESYQAWLAMKKKAKGGTVYTRATFAKMPDWSGVWTRVGGFNWNSPPLVKPESAGIGPEAAQALLKACSSFPCKGWVEADLTPEYAQRFLQKMTALAHGFEWDQLSDCLPSGYPRFLLNPFYREFTVTPKETWLSQETQGEYRRIYTDGRGHVSEDDGHPLWEGDSIGFWDGDTLVVHTIRMRAEELQRNMPAVSEDVSTVERIRMINPNTLEDDATIYDPKALRKPWRGIHHYIRVTAPVARLDMWSCAENNNVVETENGGSTFILPGEKGYKEPSDIQNIATRKAIEYGARLMAEEKAAKEKAAGK